MNSQQAYSTTHRNKWGCGICMLLALELQHQVDGQTAVQRMLPLQTSTEHYQALL
jgi:hypothetical protein